MCNQNTLQQKIAELTNDGDVILRFLTETVQAKTPGVKIHHQLEASRQLTRLGALSPSPSTGEGRDGGEKDENPTHPANPVSPIENSQLTTQTSELTTDDSPDCYYEPLSPEDQAIFAYQTLIEIGEYKESEIEVQPPTEAAHHEYATTLKWMRQAAAEEGIPLLPNPLSGTLTHPTVRSP